MKPIQIIPGETLITVGNWSYIADDLDLNVQQRIDIPYYDSKNVLAADTSTIFFDTSNANLSQSNILGGNGTLPSPNTIRVFAIGVWVDARVLPVDLVLLAASGGIEVKQDTTVYYEAPIVMQPAGAGLYMPPNNAILAAASFFGGQIGMPGAHAIRGLQKAIVLRENESYSVKIDWNVALAGLTTTRVGVVLFGIRQRSAVK